MFEKQKIVITNHRIRRFRSSARTFEFGICWCFSSHWGIQLNLGFPHRKRPRNWMVLRDPPLLDKPMGWLSSLLGMKIRIFANGVPSCSCTYVQLCTLMYSIKYTGCGNIPMFFSIKHLSSRQKNIRTRPGRDLQCTTPASWPSTMLARKKKTNQKLTKKWLMVASAVMCMSVCWYVCILCVCLYVCVYVCLHVGM